MASLAVPGLHGVGLLLCTYSRDRRCFQHTYFIPQTAPPDGHPRIVSKLLTLDYASKTCRQAYPPGEHFIVPNLPNITAVNSLGDFDIEANRLAIIDGDSMSSHDRDLC